MLNIVTREPEIDAILASSIYNNESMSRGLVTEELSVEDNVDLSRKRTLKARAMTKKGARLIAKRIHVGTHLPHIDVMRIVRRACIETEELNHALKSMGERCEICLQNGRPLMSRKRHRTLHSGYNESIQVDFCYVEELRPKQPILAITERSAGFTRHALVRSRDMDEISSVIEQVHFLEYGPPKEFRGDPEFDNRQIRDMLARNSVSFQSTPARRHNKVGQIERSHGMFKIINCFIQQAAMYSRVSGYTCNNAHIVKAASYYASLMAGKAQISPF